jgi:hypothetical protein
VRTPYPLIAVAAISNFLFRPLTFSPLLPFYDPDTINLHVLMVLSIGGIINAMLLPVINETSVFPSNADFKQIF